MWRTLLIRSLILVVVIGLGGAFLIWQNNQAIKRKNLQETVLQDLKQPKTLAFDAVAADSGAKELLGDNIRDAGGLGRDGSGPLDRSDTVLHFDVSGSKQKGRVTAHATDKGGWQITSEIDVKAADGKTIAIPKPAEKPPDIEL